jgi:para-nitrobenzyl esterase
MSLHSWGAFLALLLSACASAPPADAPVSLAGTSWQLVRFQGGDGKVVVPDERSKYTIAFAADGSVSVRFDCNRGRGSWKSDAPGRLLFGPLALTRAMCAPGSLHDQLVKHWFYVRSYVIRKGHLHLLLMADGGIYEFEPL